MTLTPMSDSPEPWLVRPLNANDVNILLQVQTACYGDAFQESEVVFRQRLTCEYHCSIGVAERHGAALKAYVAAYWSNPGKVTPLDGCFLPPEAGEQVLYVHDMSVLPELAGRGLAKYMLNHLMHLARRRGVRQAALVSVQGSQAYWKRQGFHEAPVKDAQQQAHLESYGPDALYMQAAL